MNKKIFFISLIFILGIGVVSIVKNETRKTQKEIENLKASIKDIRINLHETSLDYEVLTSPENILKLADNYLEPHFFHYEISQMNNLQKNLNLVSINNQALSKQNLPKTDLEKIHYKNKDGILYEKESNDSENQKTNKVKRWVGIQILKLALGFPVPGVK